ncbi:MAG: DUF362 domain-containing protein [Spirochaetes bacterium]|nr:DUF362 domain-containing protein [Spirochaetota bacterium]
MKKKSKIIDTDRSNKATMTRRDMLKLFAGAMTAAVTPSILSGCGTTPATVTQYGNIVSSAWIPQGGLAASYSSFKSMIEAATDFSWLSAGDSVLVKIAANSPSPFPACTDPTALQFMLQLLQEKNAGTIYVGDQASVENVFYLANTAQAQDVISSASVKANNFMQLVFAILNTDTLKTGSTRANCTQNGLLDVINAAGATPVFFDETGFDGFNAATSANGNWPRQIYLPKIIASVNHIITMPQSADDSRTGASTGMMNMAGLLRDDCRIAMDSGTLEDYFKMCVDISLLSEIASKIRLSVTSGMSVLTTAGADPGTAVEPTYGMVFASENILLHDILASSWVETNRTAVNADADVYALTPIKYYIDKKGDPSITWTQVNSNPDTSVVNCLKTFMKV